MSPEEQSLKIEAERRLDKLRSIRSAIGNGFGLFLSAFVGVRLSHIIPSENNKNLPDHFMPEMFFFAALILFIIILFFYSNSKIYEFKVNVRLQLTSWGVVLIGFLLASTLIMHSFEDVAWISFACLYISTTIWLIALIPNIQDEWDLIEDIQSHIASRGG